MKTDARELATLIDRVCEGNLEAYGSIVRRFQDMAVGYAYSILGDFHMAEDAAQEAFVTAYLDLSSLRERAAFAGWFRRIVFKQCDRLTRGKRIDTLPLEAAPEVISQEPDPAAALEDSEMKDAVLNAIQALPEHEREATTLFYINWVRATALAPEVYLDAGDLETAEIAVQASLTGHLDGYGRRASARGTSVEG